MTDNGFEMAALKGMNYASCDIIPVKKQRRIKKLKKRKKKPGKIEKAEKTESVIYNIGPGDIKIGTIIGKGADGVVHRGTYNHGIVAIKVFKQSSFSEKNILNEISTLEKIRPHPNIVVYLGSSKIDDMVVIVQELANCSLLELRTSLTPDQKVKAVRDICVGMYHLHRQSPPVIHRDLACRNVLHGRDGEFKVADFGISRLLNPENDEHVTTTKIGPVRWMAPEALFHKTTGKKSDVWSFGVTVFEVVECELPYKDIENHNMGEHIRGCVERNIKTLKISEDAGILSEIMEWCLEIDSGDRPEFGDIFREYFSRDEYENKKVSVTPKSVYYH